MKLSDVLKRILGDNLDVDVDLTSEDNSNSDVVEKPTSNSSATNNDSTTDTVVSENSTSTETVKNVVSEHVPLFTEGWFDDVTGTLDFDKISNPEVADALKRVVENHNMKRADILKDNAINTALSEKYPLNVSRDLVTKLINRDSLTVNGDKVSGVDAAIEAVRASEPNIFKDASKESNPLNEGFDPVTKTTVKAPSSFMQAFEIQEQLECK